MAETKKKSAARKKVPTKSTVTAAAVKKAAPKRAKASAAKGAVTSQERYKMIELAAYYRAERHGWQVDPHANWVAAEKEVSAQLAGGKRRAKK